MNNNLLTKMKEAAVSVLPISGIVLVLHFTIAPMSLGTLTLFLVGTVLLIAGMGIFTLGADIAMMPMGEIIGEHLTQTKKLWLIILGCFFLGIIVTVAEPDLQVLTKQVPAVPDWVLVGSVAFGVGVFLVIAMLRIVFQIKLSHLFIVLYLFVFATAAFVAPDYLAVAFDSGGVTTGPITVPFILALGVGISSARGGSSDDDSFGLCALCSVGPILAVLIMGVFFNSSSAGYAFETVQTVNSAKELLQVFGNGFLIFGKEVATALSPIVIFFAVYQFAVIKLPKSQLIRLGSGILYTFAGLTVFLTGVNIGFMPAGTYLGKTVASLPYNWILIPLSMVIGFFVVTAEPAVHVLNKQVEEITDGTISRKAMMTGLSLGVSLGLGLAMIRIMTQISIWMFLIPGYAIALILTFFVPEIFTAIAFDSGGVAAGTMAAAFILPFAMGVCTALGGNIMTDAFGIIAMVAMMPLVTIQILGLVYKIKLKRAKIQELEEEPADIEIIEFEGKEDTL